MKSEIFADIYYRLNIQTYLFAILVDHIDKETFEFTLQDFENKRKTFINCGIRQVDNCFTKDELIHWLDNHPNLIYKIGNNKWVATIKSFVGNINNLKEEELEFVHYDEHLAKIFSLLCNLQIDLRIFDSFGCVASMLHCNFLFNDETPHLSKKLHYI